MTLPPNPAPVGSDEYLTPMQILAEHPTPRTKSSAVVWEELLQLNGSFSLFGQDNVDDPCEGLAEQNIALTGRWPDRLGLLD